MRTKCSKDLNVNITDVWIGWPQRLQPHPLLFYKIQLLDAANQSSISYLLILSLDRNQTAPGVTFRGFNRASHNLNVTARRICLQRQHSDTACTKPGVTAPRAAGAKRSHHRASSTAAQSSTLLCLQTHKHTHTVPPTKPCKHVVNMKWQFGRSRKRLARFAFTWGPNSALLGESCLCDPKVNPDLHPCLGFSPEHEGKQARARCSRPASPTTNNSPVLATVGTFCCRVCGS